ncbi:MAG TPA: phosphate acyltransferase PlsX [Thermodesulfobacteriota bacterium]|nr:phosphate acyltransferase PlsX [Thermodesulfobacteriota bacterium]
MEPVRIAVDAMGGDYAPGAVVKGAVLATKEWGLPLTLVGHKDLIARELAGLTFDPDLITIHHCTEVAGMGESPIDVIRRKKDASIRVALDLLKQGLVQGVVSAGNSGATMALAVVILGKLPGVERPALGAILPSHHGPTFVIDVGANVDCTEIQLVQFAVMAVPVAKFILKRPNPKIGILSIGEEESKGNNLVRQTTEILKKTPLNFIGNAEGRDIYTGKVDIVVCDGFVGNICLKLSEGLAETLKAMLEEEIRAGFGSKVGFLLMKKAFKNFSRRVDYAEYGGVPLLGVNGTVIIGHGASNPKAIMNAIRVAGQSVQNKITDQVLEGLSQYESYYRKPSFWDSFKRKKNS